MQFTFFSHILYYYYVVGPSFKTNNKTKQQSVANYIWLGYYVCSPVLYTGYNDGYCLVVFHCKLFNLLIINVPITACKTRRILNWNAILWKKGKLKKKTFPLKERLIKLNVRKMFTLFSLSQRRHHPYGCKAFKGRGD